MSTCIIMFFAFSMIALVTAVVVHKGTPEMAMFALSWSVLVLLSNVQVPLWFVPLHPFFVTPVFHFWPSVASMLGSCSLVRRRP